MSFTDFLASRIGDLITLGIAHALLVLIAVGIATAIGVSAGILTYRTQMPRTMVLGICGIFLTIPSFALFVLFIPVFGLGVTPTVAALVLYSLLPITRNTIVGLREVNPAVSESALGMGMNRWQRLWRIELPLAWPVIITGIRVATIIVIGIAAIASIVNGPGYGELIFGGLSRVGTPIALDLALAGTLGVVVLVLLFDAGFAAIRRLTTPKGLR